MNRRLFNSRLAMLGIVGLGSLFQLVPAAAADFTSREVSPKDAAKITPGGRIARRQEDDVVPGAADAAIPDSQGGGTPGDGVTDKPKPLVKIGSFPAYPSRFTGKHGGNYRKRGIGANARRRGIVARKRK